ncbi:MAG: leucyl aminopeptidase family protein [Rubrivivax sp.]|nr:leucyl aminopeptidase family protein [Rubrivivax sp.]
MSRAIDIGLADHAAGALPLHVVHKAGLPAWLAGLPAPQRRWLQGVGFAAEPGKAQIVPGRDGEPAAVAVGGMPGHEALWTLGDLPATLPPGTYRVEGAARGAATALALGWALGAYAFTRYKAPKRAPARLAWPRGADRAEVENVAAATWLARDLVNTPAEDLGPRELLQAARDLASTHRARVRAVAGAGLLRENYPAIHAVGRAAARPPCLIDLTWGDRDAPRVTLVGKGVCFDTGGLNLKAGPQMALMKKDMGGAAVALGIARAVMGARLPVRLRVLVPAVENSVSGSALRPRDVIGTRAGKTVEITNTDAEGRLILADALSEACRDKPALLFDFATLTGAARVALGPQVQSLFTPDDELAARLGRAAAETADPLWRMPLWRGYRRNLDSKVADLVNMADGAFGDAIHAALFLSEFVDPAVPWAHLDVMAWNSRAAPGRPEGGEATGLRAVFALLKQAFA